MELFVSGHSRQRLNERFSVKGSAKATRLIGLALARGKGFADFSGLRQAYLRNKAHDDAVLIYYSGAIYVFYGASCATAYPAPGIFLGKPCTFDEKGNPVRNFRKYLRLHEPQDA